MIYSFNCIFPDYVAHEITKEKIVILEKYDS
jgi:hypothetical protein